MTHCTKFEPLISVVMPVYNAGRHLIDAVASIINQSLGDWEMICVNDGSRDGSGQLLDWFAGQDARIRVVHQANAGIVAALNRGCDLARAPLIARMDSDDIALVDRFAQQSAFLQKAPHCVAVGGAILEIDSDGDPLCRSNLPLEHEEIIGNLLSRQTGLFHPSVMMRSEAFRAVDGYRPQYEWVEDHDLWLRLGHRGQLANLPQTVLCYRQHAGSVCWQRSQQQRELMNSLLREAYAARDKEIPAGLVMASGVTRSPAGSGKWARAAAKGGYPLSVLKHLKKLQSSVDSSPAYLARMAAESTLRLASGYPRRLLSKTKPRVPHFPQWHARVSADLELDLLHNRQVA
jgi:glycosyltransferase involved in cell wall biosynthesis